MVRPILDPTPAFPIFTSSSCLLFPTRRYGAFDATMKINITLFFSETSSVSLEAVHILSLTTSLVLGPRQISPHVLGPALWRKFIY